MELRTTTKRLHDDVVTGLRDRLREAFVEVEGGPMDGHLMMSAGIFDEVWDGFWTEYEMPEPTEHAAEVRTPARIEVTTVCPECEETATGSARLFGSLTIEGNKRTLKTKAKAEGSIDHICGQMALSSGDEVGTKGMDIPDNVKDITGPMDDGKDIAGTDEDPFDPPKGTDKEA